MKCIAIDDEPIALAVISSYCKSYPYISLSTFTHPKDGMKAIAEQLPDVVFLDIEMNDYSGLELAKELPAQTILILTTAHTQYAVNGYEVNAIDFLPKPYSPKRFAAAIERAKNIMEQRKATVKSTTITIKVDYQNVEIDISRITYIESMHNYVKICLTDSKPILTKMSLKYLSELLPADDFLRVHRSYIVARSMIKSYNRQQVTLKDDSTIPIGRNYADTF